MMTEPDIVHLVNLRLALINEVLRLRRAGDHSDPSIGALYARWADRVEEMLSANKPAASQGPDLLHVKLASIVVHAQELLPADGREPDKQALLPLLADEDVTGWLASFDKALLPVKRIK